MKQKTVKSVALKDISEGMKHQQTFDNNGDIWFVFANQLNTKEIRLLNKDLGLNKINLWGNKNGIKNNLWKIYKLKR